MNRIAQAHRLRIARFSERGRVYLLTTVTKGRLPLFADFHCARQVVLALRACDEMGAAQTWAFVVMPDHVHWLVELADQSLSTLMRGFKAASALRLNRHQGQLGRSVWQRGFHDHAVRREEDLRALARYVITNPVRARLVTRAGEYSHWDAAWL